MTFQAGSSDDVSANCLELMCSVDHLPRNTGTCLENGDTWEPWLRCPEGQGICGLQTTVEAPQGGGDDTALNNIRLYCC